MGRELQQTQRVIIYSVDFPKSNLYLSERNERGTAPILMMSQLVYSQQNSDLHNVQVFLLSHSYQLNRTREKLTSVLIYLDLFLLV